MEAELGNLKIDEIDRGLLVDQINEHLARCVADIADVSKKAEKKRSVVVTIDFHPSKSRREAACQYSVMLKPSTHIDREPTTIYLGRGKDGTAYAKPYETDQQDLFEPSEMDAANLPDSN